MVLFLRFFILIAVVISSFKASSASQWDSAVAIGARSYPVGGSIDGEGGYGIPVWGSPGKAGPGRSPWYGYIRPAFSGSTAGFWNQGVAELEVFPISILGFSTGASYTSSTQDFGNFDCDTFYCRGQLTSQLFRAHLTLGYKKVFLYSQFRYDKYEFDRQSQPFLIVEHALRGAAEGDDMRRVFTLLGYNWSDKWSFMAMHSYAQTLEFGEINTMVAGVIRYNFGRWSVIAGAGLFESPLKEDDFNAFTQLRWQIKPLISIY